MGFDKCDSTPVQDYNGDNAKEHLLPQRYEIYTCHGVEVAIINSMLKCYYCRRTIDTYLIVNTK